MAVLEAKELPHGALLIDKPAGITSAGVIRRLKSTGFKLGHAGTLDPMATGLLVVLVNKATRLQSVVLGTDKTYEGVIRLGMTTSSDDITGEVLSTTECQFGVGPEADGLLDTIRRELSGKRQQLPPLVSAIKVQGQRSYDLARRGLSVELTPREVRIEFQELSWRGPQELNYRVYCSKGTYVRSIAREIGELLGVGATLASIRRVACGGYSVADAHSIESLRQRPLAELLIPLEALVASLPKIVADDEQRRLLRLGVKAPLQSFSSPSGPTQAALVDCSGGFLGLLNYDSGLGWTVGFLM